MSLLKKVEDTFSSDIYSPQNGSKTADSKPGPESLFPVLLDTILSPITYVDKDFNYQYVNKVCAEWFGAKLENIIGKPVSAFLDAEAYTAARPYMERAIRGETARLETETAFADRKSVV